MQERLETIVDSDKGSSHEERMVLYIPERPHRSNRLRELENLCKQVHDLEIELKSRNRRRVREGSSNDPDYAPDGSSSGCGSRQSRDQS